jgi:hypothetical protein
MGVVYIYIYIYRRYEIDMYIHLVRPLIGITINGCTSARPTQYHVLHHHTDGCTARNTAVDNIDYNGF